MHEAPGERVDHPLPPGWYETVTPDGESYFFHVVTGETSWDRPKYNAPGLGASGATVPPNDLRPTLSGSTTSSQTYGTAYQAQPGFMHASDQVLHPLQKHAPDVHHNPLQAPYSQHSFNVLHSPHYSYEHDEGSRQQQPPNNMGATRPSQQNCTPNLNSGVHVQFNASNGQLHDGRAPKGNVPPKPAENDTVSNDTKAGKQTLSVKERLGRMSFAKNEDAALKNGGPRAGVHHATLPTRTATRIPDTACGSPSSRHNTAVTGNMPDNCKNYERRLTSDSSTSTVNIPENEKKGQSKNNLDEGLASTRNIQESSSLAKHVTHDEGMFVLDQKRVLTINLTEEHDYAWIKNGSMVSL